ncbi:pantetheine-phosphate adenylyltransferase [Thermoanaerobacterium thermosaccharolyticum]|jgi:pantetheine-phosphate adenylyltransferase|uniref:Phosphopantetheine adenylyltransferase n=2 Tax=Thermoanaerobacterium thermosaccharolyticum TaxID=1517 RepID=A0A231VKM1_THETR|nr:pantetheine-phosphate adenylyltransferase [Thermoanaerobacterium thermosaccharolyticum]TCW38734.1 phosphopantetheine adenylyltransferase [Thermohydrogenium kirishiense]AGB19113.1 pantetheine-phosphate adenylyltransferase [Thermoanaerobacterium thermosaccharolyticum M0795]AST58939.1 phosphopantetheine adenylyltransferase [Thermoanaerobacterium thermosaccharolyticum]KAA5806102.1 pantetheine-phosphate adenylyltransferase [Thermoanaerobacterium thermosaccharolyticum]MBE0068298.1 pantetheine-pho
MNIAVYPGSFDPVTNGHLDVIKRAAKVFDKLIVAVLINPSKTPMFSVEERVEMLREVTSDIENVEIDCFSGLLIEYLEKVNSKIIVKGLRMVSDFEYEFQMALINKKLNPEVETIFFMTSNKYGYLSSSIVKEVASFGGCLSDLVPDSVIKHIFKKLKK